MERIEQHIVDLVKEFEAITNRRDSARAQAILKELKTIGQTAAFFGGYDGMKQVHDAAEKLVGNTNDVGYWLNNIWDGIADWYA
jgi:hypothetical protein